jgi:hypothetical protein
VSLGNFDREHNASVVDVPVADQASDDELLPDHRRINSWCAEKRSLG